MKPDGNNPWSITSTMNTQQDQINRILQSLEGLRPADAPPFLYAKVKARLAQKKEQGYSFLSVFSRPAVSFTILLLAVLMNVLILTRTGPQKTNTATNSSVEIFAKEYGLVSYSAYDKHY